MPKLKLPTPPLPTALQRRPPRPGEAERVGPLDGIGQYIYPGRFSTPKNP